MIGVVQNTMIATIYAYFHIVWTCVAVYEKKRERERGKEVLSESPVEICDTRATNVQLLTIHAQKHKAGLQTKWIVYGKLDETILSSESAEISM